MAQVPIPSTETEFTIEIKACAPIAANGDKGELIINVAAGSSYTAVVPPLDACGCDCPSEQANPLYIYDLKRRFFKFYVMFVIIMNYIFFNRYYTND